MNNARVCVELVRRALCVLPPMLTSRTLRSTIASTTSIKTIVASKSTRMGNCEVTTKIRSRLGSVAQWRLILTCWPTESNGTFGETSQLSFLRALIESKKMLGLAVSLPSLPSLINSNTSRVSIDRSVLSLTSPISHSASTKIHDSSATKTKATRELTGSILRTNT